MSNYKKLEDAGLIKPGALFTREQFEVIETLTDEEVEALISIEQKLTHAFATRTPKLLGTIETPNVQRDN